MFSIQSYCPSKVVFIEMIWLKVVSIDWSSLKSEARRIIANSGQSPSCESHLKTPCHLNILLAIGNEIAKLHLKMRRFFYIAQLLAKKLITNLDNVP